MNRRCFIPLLGCFIAFSRPLSSQIVLEGVVTDNGAEYFGNGAEPVADALVTITDQANAARTFSAYTDAQGHYAIQISSTGVDDSQSSKPDSFILLQNYPNPFNPTTVIGYELQESSDIAIEIYNVLGHRVRTLVDDFAVSGSGQVTWDACDDLGRGVPAGVYIYTLSAGSTRISKKMLLLDGRQGRAVTAVFHSNDTAVAHQNVLHKQLSDQYALSVTGSGIAPYEQKNLTISADMTLPITVSRTVADIDGNIYSTVKIGDQWVTGENLRVTRYRNGEAIPCVTDDTAWLNVSTGAYCNCDNDTGNVFVYGRLYNWYAVEDSRNIAPEGWHVPSESEWKRLTDFLGGIEVAGGKLKEAGITRWWSPNTGATNETGFSALPGGFRSCYGSFSKTGCYAYFWTSTELESGAVRSRSMVYFHEDVRRYYVCKLYGYSVRLFRDE